mmetsp:Transcript_9964/g.23845  ORF Transcript_9964/g.23845 Transcript_9964/m.23845 type:complete len:218 (+) Transcript_9964:122-775(+)
MATSAKSDSSAARSSRASLNSPSSMPSPTNQCTNARLPYMRSNLWSRRANTSAMAVVLLSMHTARRTGAMSPLGTAAGALWLMPHLKPVGDQSTNWMLRLPLTAATAAFTSLGTTSPRYMRHVAMYLPWRGSHLAIMAAGSNAALVISDTDSCSWYAFSALSTGAYEHSMKWMRGYGTRFVWNSVTSTLSEPSKRSDAVSDEITCAMRRFRLLYVGR